MKIIENVLVHDGLHHMIQILINGNCLTLKVDNQEPQMVVNSGTKKTFELSTKNYLYIGGVSDDIGQKAVAAFHLNQNKSFKGLNILDLEKF